MSWKYRGQVVPRNQRITVTLELTQRDRDARGAFARGTAALWVDGKRIYEAVGLGMRIVDGPATLGQNHRQNNHPGSKRRWPGNAPASG